MLQLLYCYDWQWLRDSRVFRYRGCHTQNPLEVGQPHIAHSGSVTVTFLPPDDEGFCNTLQIVRLQLMIVFSHCTYWISCLCVPGENVDLQASCWTLKKRKRGGRRINLHVTLV